MQLVSPTDMRISKMYGPMVHMKAGVPSEVPTALVKKAKALGCTAPGSTPVTPAVSEPEEDHTEELKAVIQSLMDSGDAEAFDAHGRPRMTVLKEKCGFKVTSEQRDAAWENMNDSE